MVVIDRLLEKSLRVFGLFGGDNGSGGKEEWDDDYNISCLKVRSNRSGEEC